MDNNSIIYESNSSALSFNLLDDNDIEQAKFIYDSLQVYVSRYLKVKIDYGTIPYCGDKPVLFKAGAEKLCRLFKLRASFEIIDKILDYDNKLFHFHYRCNLSRSGEIVGMCDAIANSREKKFVKQVGYDLAVVNTICKMAQKRALVGAVLIVCGASEYFTQDLEDS